MYFSKFPVVSYPSNIGENTKYVLARNILRRVALSDNTLGSNGAFIEYHIKDGEKPEHIADRVYGNPEEHWIILLTNNIIDPYYDWYKSGVVMEGYILEKHSGFSVFFTDTSDQFVYNAKLYNGCTLSQGGISSAITDYDSTLCKLQNDTKFSTGSATIGLSGGGTLGIKIQRVVESYVAVHHFGGYTTGDSPIVDPLSKQTNNYDSYEEMGSIVSGNPVTGIRSVVGSSGSVQLWQTYIGRYMGISGSPVGNYAITNYKYENDKNDSKRKIKILHPRYLDTVKKELDALLRS